MKIEKKKAYYLIDEVASMYECSRDDLIHWGAVGELPIHVLADSWTVEIHSGYVQEQDEEDVYGNNFPLSPRETYGEDRTIVGRTFLHPSSIKIKGTVRLLASTLAKYEANPKTTERSFYCDAPNGDDEAVYEYRLSELVGGHKQTDIDLAACRFVILNKYLSKLDNLTVSHGEEIKLNKTAVETLPANTKSLMKMASAKVNQNEEENSAYQTLQKQLGVLAWLLCTKNPKFTYKGKPNSLQISEAAFDLLVEKACEVDKFGMKSSQFRANITRGLKLLLGA